MASEIERKREIKEIIYKSEAGKQAVLGKYHSLSRLTMPVLMLFGDSDQLIPASKSIKRLKQFAQQAKIELLSDTGHLMVNQTERILTFLKNRT